MDDRLRDAARRAWEHGRGERTDRAPGRPPCGVLSGREVDVLQCAANGQRNAEIAAALGVSTETVKSHMRHVLQKLGAKSRAHAIAIAWRAGLIE